MMYDYNTWRRFTDSFRRFELSGKLYEGLWNYFTDIHPKTEGQYRNQQFFAGWNSYYSNWMYARSQDERNSHTRQLYDIGWSDIQYPWLSGVTSGNEAKTLGSAASWQFSKNIGSLYR